MYGNSWSPVIGEVLVRGLLNEIFAVFKFVVGTCRKKYTVIIVLCTVNGSHD